MTPLRPTTAKERHVVLDALRGMALLGIALANFPEFALWTWLRPWLLDGARLYRIDSSHCVCCPNSSQRLVATVVPLRTFGVDLAHADIRELLQVIPKMKRQ